MRPDSVIEIPDMRQWLLEWEQAGELRIRRFEALTANERISCDRMIAMEIEACGLKSQPDSGYAQFLRDRFPKAWAQAGEGEPHF